MLLIGVFLVITWLIGLLLWPVLEKRRREYAERLFLASHVRDKATLKYLRELAESHRHVMRRARRVAEFSFRLRLVAAHLDGTATARTAGFLGPHMAALLSSGDRERLEYGLEGDENARGGNDTDLQRRIAYMHRRINRMASRLHTRATIALERAARLTPPSPHAGAHSAWIEAMKQIELSREEYRVVLGKAEQRAAVMRMGMLRRDELIQPEEIDEGDRRLEMGLAQLAAAVNMQKEAIGIRVAVATAG